MFDFSLILERTEKRVERDLLASGPTSVEELRSIAAKLKYKYQSQLDRKRQQAEKQLQKEEQQPTTVEKTASGSDIPDFAAPPANTDGTTTTTNESSTSTGGGIKMQGFRNVAGQGLSHATNVASGATNMAAGVFAKIKSPGFNPLRKSEDGNSEQTSQSQQVAAPPDLLSGSASEEDGDGDWVQAPRATQPPTDAIAHFSIDDDDDML